MARHRWRFWAWPWELRRCGILGMNARNADFILPNNPRTHYPRVDDKLLTKRICDAHGIPVPETYAVIERQGDIGRLAERIGDRERFVVKPAQGSGGRGILVIAGRNEHGMITSSGETITPDAMCYHLSAVLAGLYSLGGRYDRAIVEQCILRHQAFEPIAVDGTPDIRIIVYRGTPAMAMVRLPTRASRGRANLHQGAVGAGIEITTGRTLGGVCRSRVVDRHPDTCQTIAGRTVPHWNRLLEAAVQLAECLEMGYIGVDFVLDEVRGPVVLEANARPGLAIQLANRTGLLPRLREIDARIAARSVIPMPVEKASA